MENQKVMGPRREHHHVETTRKTLSLDEQKYKFIQAVKEAEKEIQNLKGRLDNLWTTKLALLNNLKKVENQIKGIITDP